jgi:hypothetical protein
LPSRHRRRLSIASIIRHMSARSRPASPTSTSLSRRRSWESLKLQEGTLNALLFERHNKHFFAEETTSISFRQQFSFNIFST